MTKDERISKEIERLKSVYKNLSKDEAEYVDGMIRRAAYLQITLEDLEADLSAKGLTEQFSQSSNMAPYDRERPAARLYSNLMKNYQVVMKQLGDFVSKTPKETGPADDKLDKFLKED